MVAVLPLRLHVCTAAVNRPTGAAVLADGAIHHGAAAFRQVKDPNREGIGTGIRRLPLAGLRAGSLLQLLLQPFPAVAVEVGKLTGTGLDPYRAVVLENLARVIRPQFVVGDGPRTVAAHAVMDALAVAAVDLNAGDDRITGERLDGVVIPPAGDRMLDAVVTASSAGVWRRDTKPVEFVGHPLVAPVGLKPFENANPDRDLSLVIRLEANMAALLLHLDVVLQFLDDLAGPGIAKESAETVGRPPARAVALRRPLRLHEHDSLRELAAELAALVIAEEGHGRLT